jgi:hypothetical protein
MNLISLIFFLCIAPPLNFCFTNPYSSVRERVLETKSHPEICSIYLEVWIFHLKKSLLFFLLFFTCITLPPPPSATK